MEPSTNLPLSANPALPASMPLGSMPLIGALSMRQAVIGMVMIAAAITVAIGTWLWAKEPDYRVLFSNLNDRDGGAIIAALSPMNVPYKITEGGGAILVPAAQVHELRLRLASQGLPKGSVVGMELVDNQKFGATQFQEQMNFQRGLEGELARSIQALNAVQAARVHLAIPKPSVFLREQQTPSASVLLTLHQGRTLDRAQINGIAHLVASSVPELALDRVSIVDQTGGLLSQRRDAGDSSLDSVQLAYIRQIEQATIQRITDILEPVVGRDNVRVQVTADVDFTRSESMAESFKPNQDAKTAALRTQQTTESITAGGAGASGVPGALSNQPPAAGVAVIDGKTTTTAGTAGTPPTSTRRDATTAYEVDKKIEHTRASTGGVRRMTAAVVVNHRKTVDAASGKATLVALTAAEVEQITALTREAMGFSKERGDSLNVANAPFTEPVVEPVAEVPFWKAPDNIAMAKEYGRYTLFAIVILYLFFGVLRPLMRQAAATPPAALPAPPPEGESAIQGELTQAAARNGDQLARARQLAREDPKIVANIVKGWVNPDE